MMQLRYLAAAGALVGALGINLLALSAQTMAQTAANRAGLILQSKNGSVTTRCIAFDEPELNGYELLRRSNLPIVVESGGLGVTVCKIGQDGCAAPTQSCFCECQDLGATCAYWIYFTAVNGAWRYSALGALGQKVVNGSVHGWVWGNGNASGAKVTPPLMSFDQICNSATATPQPTAQASAAPGGRPATPSNVGELLAFGGVAAVLVATLWFFQRRAKRNTRP